ncbi:22646_t:CDS:2 [Racocetra persica]|uniref:22646_t:CDS:1 n=1 Tax=Racocetra persica TaxID=160502 RepID=A0ACA9N8L4_9GLOM|nr:22646_t:CDS:2 [Racocetra persica]
MSYYYNHIQFDNVSVNMNTKKVNQYCTNNGVYFAKIFQTGLSSSVRKAGHSCTQLALIVDISLPI